MICSKDRPKASGDRLRRLILGGALLTVLPAMPALAGKRELPPLSYPMACPIDAPVRVASSDTLKRFTALENCTPEAVIVSPATQLPRARATVVIAPASDEADDAGRGLFFAETDAPRTRRAKGRKKRSDPPAAIVETATMGPSNMTVVRIAPAVQFPELEMAAVSVDVIDADTVTTTAAGPVPALAVAAGPLTAAAILALRPASYTSPHDDIISAAAARHGVDPLVLHAVITQESRYRSNAVSPVGARGLMQVMPGTGAMLGVRNPAQLMNPTTNVDAGAKLLKRLWQRFSGRFDLVLAAYNAGEGAVTKYGYRVPPYRETQNYVVGVKAIYRKLVAERGLSFAGR